MATDNKRLPEELTKKIRYPGSLAKPITVRQTIAAMLGDYDLWINDWENEHLILLLDHYKIARDEKHLWFHLALQLARDHVPAFKFTRSKPRGRPAKRVRLNQLMRTGLKNKPGRKKTLMDEDHRGLLNWVKKVANENEYSGHGAITKTLQKIIADTVKRRGLGESIPRATKEHLPKLQKRYSDAKRKFPELAI